VKDTQGNLVLGRTRWRRFAALAIPAGVIAAGLFAGVAAGAVPVSVNVSGQTFKVQAEELDGTGFAQYPGVVTKPDGTVIPVAASAIKSADLTKMCQSVRIPNTPIVLVIKSGWKGEDAHADNLLIGLNELGGNAEFGDITIGTDASKVTLAGEKAVGSAGDFGQEAATVNIKDLKQTAYSTHAGTFRLPGLNMSLNFSGDKGECFATVPKAE
jgi:Family of unknown function (DUF6230)